jgi:hypothetical protein
MAGGRDETLDRVATAIRIAGVPLRLAILRAIAGAGPLSPSQFVTGSEGDVTLREAAYHFRYLRDGELIVLDQVETTGGTAQHFYALSPVGRAVVRALPSLERAAT